MHGRVPPPCDGTGRKKTGPVRRIEMCYEAEALAVPRRRLPSIGGVLHPVLVREALLPLAFVLAILFTKPRADGAAQRQTIRPDGLRGGLYTGRPSRRERGGRGLAGVRKLQPVGSDHWTLTHDRHGGGDRLRPGGCWSAPSAAHPPGSVSALAWRHLPLPWQPWPRPRSTTSPPTYTRASLGPSLREAMRSAGGSG